MFSILEKYGNIMMYISRVMKYDLFFNLTHKIQLTKITSAA